MVAGSSPARGANDFAPQPPTRRLHDAGAPKPLQNRCKPAAIAGVPVDVLAGPSSIEPDARHRYFLHSREGHGTHAAAKILARRRSHCRRSQASPSCDDPRIMGDRARLGYRRSGSDSSRSIASAGHFDRDRRQVVTIASFAGRGERLGDAGGQVIARTNWARAATLKLGGAKRLAEASRAVRGVERQRSCRDAHRGGALDGVKERLSIELSRIEALAGRSMTRGTHLLATIGARRPLSAPSGAL
jgi:hypothetical protein